MLKIPTETKGVVIARIQLFTRRVFPVPLLLKNIPDKGIKNTI